MKVYVNIFYYAKCDFNKKNNLYTNKVYFAYFYFIYKVEETNSFSNY